MGGGGGNNTTTTTTVVPPTPAPAADILDYNIQSAGVAQRRKLMARAGYRASFLTGARGEGTPQFGVDPGPGEIKPNQGTSRTGGRRAAPDRVGTYKPGKPVIDPETGERDTFRPEDTRPAIDPGVGSRWY